MKHLLAGITVLAAAGAVLGAAGYYVYKKSKAEDDEYEELIFTDEEGEEYIEVEPAENNEKMEKVVRVAGDVKDIVSSAAENVATTVSDAFYDVKEAIDSVIDEESPAL